MGGIPTNLDGETPLPGLFAAGECACVSVHGANRLGGNSLLDTLVFGARAGKKASQTAGLENAPSRKALLQDGWNMFQSHLEEIFSRHGDQACFQVRDEMKSLMTSHVGIFRKEPDLLVARDTIRQLKERFKQITVRQRGLAFNYELIQYLELEAMLHVAEVIVAGALARNESRGSHYRVDYPARDDEHWLRHTLAFHAPDGPRLEYKDVTITNYPPKERTY